VVIGPVVIGPVGAVPVAMGFGQLPSQ
jgi:hypothetical protein